MAKEAEQTQQETDDLIALLDAADKLPGVKELRALSYELLGAAPGTSAVDVGCGAGCAVAELAERGVKAVGVDPDKRMIAVAHARWPEADFRIAGAYELPLVDSSVHGYRADKVFHELVEPERALAEARRVLVPGGRIVLIGQDWDTFVIDSDDPALTRTIVHARAGMTAGPRSARRYRNLLLDAGFGEVTVEVHTGVFIGAAMLPLLAGLVEGACSTGAVTREQTDAWTAEQRARAEVNRLFMALPMFVATGTAPR
ncbi:methyltransferase domain-containing protein [Streptomyces sp. PSKA54]|uniref:Methyltransferase domain-containing protein n=1 Tax=Streptomyces himalayensis subsp. aureolus TaxID=2758039 RepID=A0A7W2D482_9ACTN|nr:methyltransferase domain-containing protein [Streptomyces himalayensis]MBA4864160.1 methyltransferase domain-containing protein [Streptomyces himalayensis subsp. aureolus]